MFMMAENLLEQSLKLTLEKEFDSIGKIGTGRDLHKKSILQF